METAKREMKNEIALAIDNCEALTQEELKKIFDEAIAFKESLPPEEQGSFSWESCLECLHMLVL